MENLLDKTTQLWVKLTGKKINPTEYNWLIGPIGNPNFIGDQYIESLCKNENLEVHRNQADFGLLERTEDIGISPTEKNKIHPEIIDFYENTSNYNFEFWSKWCGIFYPFGWLLSILFSKRLQQLNLPLSSMEASQGLESEIVKLKSNQFTKWTIWYRKLKATNNVIYSGIYTSCNPKKYDTPLLKVIFPLPNGNASVIMTKIVLQDGSLLLSSDEKKFGDNGFYFILANKNGKYWARYIRSMHEWIKVYVDSENVLRANYNLNFFGFRFLELHYKMVKKR